MFSLGPISFDFNLITAANGWAQALAGACIVMSGLTILFCVISQFHKVVDLLEKKPDNKAIAPQVSDPDQFILPDPYPADEQELLPIYKKLTATLGDAFPLTELYRSCSLHNIPHPHLTIKNFLEKGLLVSGGEDLFSWR